MSTGQSILVKVLTSRIISTKQRPQQLQELVYFSKDSQTNE